MTQWARFGRSTRSVTAAVGSQAVSSQAVGSRAVGSRAVGSREVAPGRASGAPSRPWMAVLAFVGFLALGVNPVAAQVLQFSTAVEDDRKIVLRWNRVPGDTLTPAERRATTARLFGGYQVWRSDFETPGEFLLLRTYSLIDSTWTLPSVGESRTAVDPDSIIVRGCTGVPLPGDPFTCDPLTGKAVAPFNGFLYYYAVTWFEAQADTIGGSPRWTQFDMQTPAQGRLIDPVQPSPRTVSAAPLLGKVSVVPNPFNPADVANRQQFGAESRISFINLPSPATVRIFTAAGDLVKVIENQDDNGAEDWDLKNGNGEDVVGGIYLFQVETSGGSLSKRGHFVVIR